MAARKPAVTSAPLTIAEFHKALDQISHSHSRYENFRLFIEAAYCALARRTALSRARAEALEASYMAIVKRYSREPEAPRRMAELFGRLGLALSCYHGDFLGEAYMTAEFGNKYAGQFFTPYCISSLIARMSVTRECVEEALAAGHPYPLRLLEPASGAASMVLAVAEHLQEEGFDLSKSLFATLVDIDPLCVQMGFLQLSFKNVPAACVHGNSLVPIEEYSFAYTIAGALQRGLPVWGIHALPPEGFEIKRPPFLTERAPPSESPVAVATPAAPTASAEIPRKRSARKAASSEERPAEAEQIELF